MSGRWLPDMPSLRTRQAYDRAVLGTAQSALSEAAAAVSDATATLTTVQGTLEEIAEGTIDLDGITVGGVRYETVGGDLVAVP